MFQSNHAQAEDGIFNAMNILVSPVLRNNRRGAAVLKNAVDLSIWLCVAFFFIHTRASPQTHSDRPLNRTIECTDADLRGCVQVLADSISIWEEEEFYEGLPSTCHWEVCTSMLMERYAFQFDSPEDNPMHWHSWIEVMALAEVPEAILILEAWMREDRPREFLYDDARPGGFRFNGTPSGMEFNFIAYY